MDAGRMSVVQDPTGATVALWQPKRNPGAGLMGEPGALAWFELMTSDPAKAQDFYTKLAGWTTKTQDMGTMKYTVASVGEAMVAGMMQAEAKVPSNWLVYFLVADCDASAAKARQLGANTHVPPTDIPNVGRFSVLQDPQGAWFAIIKFKMP
jgi:predicted enzyme related to lactoylglutathione lyase